MHVMEWAQAEWDHELDLSWLSMMDRAKQEQQGGQGTLHRRLASQAGG